MNPLFLSKMNPYIFTIDGFGIRWYSVLILVGVIVGMVILSFETSRFHIGNNTVTNLAFYTMIAGIIGARAYYVIFNFDQYKDNIVDIFKIWNGGLAIHGGLIAGLIAIVIFCKSHDVRPLKMLDMAAPSVIIAQAIGRWGNFFNFEAHGAATSAAKLKSHLVPGFVVNGMCDGSICYEPTFYYESIWCLLGFILLIYLRRRKYLKVGMLLWTYFMWYGAGRFVIESMRTDSLMFGGFRAAQIVSVVIFVIGLFGMMIDSRKGKFEDLYNEALS